MPQDVTFAATATVYTFSAMGDLFHVRAEDIALANPTVDPRRIRAGDRITIPVRPPQPARSTVLSHERDRHFAMAELVPAIRAAARRYHIDPVRLACIIHQESFDPHDRQHRVRNWFTHEDGTGTGLIGLDPRIVDGRPTGELERFRRWAAPGTTDFPGRAMRMRRAPPPELQIYYLARRLGELSELYDGLDAATRAWNTGSPTGAGGAEYLESVNARRERLGSSVLTALRAPL